MAYDSQRDKLYWAVEGEFRQLSSGSNSSSSLVEVTSPVGMAVDYIGQRLYWIEANTRVCATVVCNIYYVHNYYNVCVLFATFCCCLLSPYMANNLKMLLLCIVNKDV